jgi:acetyl-CoA acetyltransferase
MRQAVIAGVAMTPFGKFLERSVRQMAEAAVADALRDAGCTTDDIGMVFFGNAASGLITGQEMIRGQAALRHSGLMGKPIVNVDNACASGATALHLAWLAVASGQVDCALAVGAEKLSHVDKRVTFGALEAKNLKAHISGSGGIDGKGHVDNLDLDMSGSGRFADIAASRANVTMSGSGRATIAAQDQARVRISGSATVRMPTKPPQLDVSVSGSGHVVTASAD